MKVILLYEGKEHEINVRKHESIAAAAARVNIDIYGGCHGQNICGGCSREVAAGIRQILNNRKQEPYVVSGNGPPYVKTCIATPSGEGVVINAHRRSWPW